MLRVVLPVSNCKKKDLFAGSWFEPAENAFTTDLFTIPLLIKNRVSIFAPLKVDFGDIVLFKNKG